MKLRPRQRSGRPRSSQTARSSLTYYRSAGKADSSPFERRTPKTGRARRIITGFINLLIGVALIAGLIYSLIVNPVPRLTVSSDLYHPKSTYSEAATKQFSRLKNRNKITFDSTSIVNHLNQRFPEISKAQIELPVFSQTAKLSIDVAGPSLFLNSQGSQYIINDDGLAVTKAENLSQIKGLPTVVDQASLPLAPGKRVLSTAQVSFIRTLVSQCQKARVPIKSLSLPTQSQQLDFRTADHDYYVKFLLNDQPMMQIGQFLAARHQFDKNGAQPAEYLDARVPGKIFYK